MILFVIFCLCCSQWFKKEDEQDIGRENNSIQTVLQPSPRFRTDNHYNTDISPQIFMQEPSARIPLVPSGGLRQAPTPSAPTILEVNLNSRNLSDSTTSTTDHNTSAISQGRISQTEYSDDLPPKYEQCLNRK